MPELRNTLLIARREYRERTRTRSFAVMTIFTPLIMAFFLFAGAWFSGAPHINLGGHHSVIIAVYFLFFLMYMSVMMYGIAVARSIADEKSSRVFEILLTAATPGELMAGKVLGVGSVGLTQIAIWIAAALLFTSTPLTASLTGGPISLPIGLPHLLFFALMFTLGFLFYASIAAILGAIVNTEQELSQLNFILVLPLASTMVLLAPVMLHPNAHLAVVATFVPCWTPLILFARVALAHPPLWQVLASIATLAASSVLLLAAAARIYRTGILMTGKRPTPAELLRWLRSR